MKKLAKAMRSSVRDNATAYGYSITITGTAALLANMGHVVTPVGIFGGMLAAAAAFVAIEGAIVLTVDDLEEDESEEDRVLARMLNIVSIFAAMGAGFGSAYYLADPYAWPVAGFCATAAFVLFDGLELRLTAALKGK